MTPIAMIIADGVKAESLAMLHSGLIQAGAMPILISVGHGTVKSADGQEFEPDATFENAPSDLFAALVLPDGQQAVDCLASDCRSVQLLKDQYRECKTILAVGASSALLARAGIKSTFPDGTPDPGVLVAAATEASLVVPLMTAIGGGYSRCASNGP